MTTASSSRTEPSARAAAYIRRRGLRAVESFRSAADCIGPVVPGRCVFALTRGQFSMIDVVHHVLTEIGGGHLSIWTWAIAQYEIETLTGLMLRSDILSARLVLDQSADKRSPDLVEAWRERWGVDQVRILRNHAKIARVWNDRFRVLARGSFNLNWNPRTEQMDLDEGSPAFDLVASIEDDLPVLPRNASSAEIMAAGKLDQAFPAETLALFVNPGVPAFAADLKTWER
jgi:hypothetical protein